MPRSLIARGLILCGLCCLVGGASETLAGPGPAKTFGAGSVVLSFPGSVENEAEPNDSCAQANGPLTLDLPVRGEITPGDHDWYSLDVLAGQIVVIETFAVPQQPVLDTQLRLLAADCVTELDFDDDGGLGFFSQIVYIPPATETVFIEAEGYDPGANGFYDLLVKVYAKAEHDQCAGAIDLREQGRREFTVNTCNGTPDYDPGASGCTGFGMLGSDLVYKIFLDGVQLAVDLQSDYDLGLYLVSDCADVVASCLSGADRTGEGGIETLIYYPTAPGEYFLIIDSEGSCGEVNLTIASPLATDFSSWGAIKVTYR
jgi:hypothetical protein